MHPAHCPSSWKRCEERLLFDEVVKSLPAEAQNILEWLRQADGHVLWSLFIRRAGEVRIMGAGRRDREHPERKPASPAEMLWYRGMVGRAFLQLDAEPQEYAYLPDEIHQIVETVIRPATPSHRAGRPPRGIAHPHPANDRILDQTCTWLAVMRLPKPLSEAEKKLEGMQLPFVQSLLGPPDSSTAKANLTQHRCAPSWKPTGRRPFQALQHLADQHADQRFAPAARLDFRRRVAQRPTGRAAHHPGIYGSPAGKHLVEPRSFVNAIHDSRPDFQRPTGDYDTWFIRSEATQEYLRGFGHWEAVEGNLIRWIITVPLHMLGVVDLAAPDEKSPPTAFRRSAWAEALLNGKVASRLACRRCQHRPHLQRPSQHPAPGAPHRSLSNLPLLYLGGRTKRRLPLPPDLPLPGTRRRTRLARHAISHAAAQIRRFRPPATAGESHGTLGEIRLPGHHPTPNIVARFQPGNIAGTAKIAGGKMAGRSAQPYYSYHQTRTGPIKCFLPWPNWAFWPKAKWMYNSPRIMSHRWGKGSKSAHRSLSLVKSFHRSPHVQN